MDQKELPPPYPGIEPVYPGAGHGFDQQYTAQSPASGQTNMAFSGPQYPAYAPPPQIPVVQQQSNTTVVIAQAQGGGGTVIEPAPIDYTTQAYIACLCCFWPTGLMAIMKANESRDALARGDIDHAHMAANSARYMIRISYVVGICAVIAIILIAALSA